jgi:hypothetical protein
MPVYNRHLLKKCFVVLTLGQVMLGWIVLLKKKKPNSVAWVLYRPSDRRLSAKLVPTFADRGCHVFGVTYPYGRILAFLDGG